jgi:hypothetical protein
MCIRPVHVDKLLADLTKMYLKSWSEAFQVALAWCLLAAIDSLLEVCDGRTVDVHANLSELRNRGQLTIELFPPLSIIIYSWMSASWLTFVQWLATACLVVHVTARISSIFCPDTGGGDYLGVSPVVLSLLLEDDRILHQPVHAISAANAIGNLCVVVLMADNMQFRPQHADSKFQSNAKSLPDMIAGLALLVGCNAADIITVLASRELTFLYDIFEMLSNTSKSTVSQINVKKA